MRHIKTPIFILVLMLMTNSPAYAGLVEDIKGVIETAIGGVEKKVEDVETKISDIPQTVRTSLGVNLDPDVIDDLKVGIGEIRERMSTLREKINTFGDGEQGTQCYYFREDMKFIFSRLNELGTHMISLGLPGQQDMDAPQQDLVDDVPCKFLVGLWLSFEKIPLDSMLDKLSQSVSAMEQIAIVFESQVKEADNAFLNETIYADFSSTQQFYHPGRCDKVLERERLISGAATYLKINSLAFNALGSWIDNEEITGVSQFYKLTPHLRDKSVGIHGYADIKLSRDNPAHQLGSGLKTFGNILSSISDHASGEVTSCKNSSNLKLIYDQQQEILRLVSPVCPEGSRQPGC